MAGFDSNLSGIQHPGHSHGSDMISGYNIINLNGYRVGHYQQPATAANYSHYMATLIDQPQLSMMMYPQAASTMQQMQQHMQQGGSATANNMYAYNAYLQNSIQFKYDEKVMCC